MNALKTAATDSHTIEFTFDKETKNTVRYAETPNDEGFPPLIGTVYLAKWALGKTPPESITLTLTTGAPGKAE